MKQVGEVVFGGLVKHYILLAGSSSVCSKVISAKQQTSERDGKQEEIWGKTSVCDVKQAGRGIKRRKKVRTRLTTY